jgi:hypothetical protein
MRISSVVQWLIVISASSVFAAPLHSSGAETSSLTSTTGEDLIPDVQVFPKRSEGGPKAIVTLITAGGGLHLPNDSAGVEGFAKYEHGEATRIGKPRTGLVIINTGGPKNFIRNVEMYGFFVSPTSLRSNIRIEVILETLLTLLWRKFGEQ